MFLTFLKWHVWSVYASHHHMQGPCLEYVLRHKLLNTLVTTAKDDVRGLRCMNCCWLTFWPTVPNRNVQTSASLLYDAAR